MSRAARIGVDVGGTFTDIVLALPGGRIHVNKTTTTPADPGEGVAAGVAAVLEEAGLDPREVAEVVHGTTVASNTILQKVGARTGLLTTRGFRDVLEIGRIRTPGMFNMAWSKPEPLVPRRWRLEAHERIGAGGGVVTPLDEASVRKAAAMFLAERVEAVAVCFINSYANDAHERRAAAILRETAPQLLVTASFEVLPEIREYERTSTAVVNAYLLPAMRGYLSKLAERLAAIGVTAPVQVMASNGGMIGIGTARERPVFAVGSGPAGGVAGSARLGPAIGARDLIVFDMGGTTAKAAIVEGGEPQTVTEYEFRDGISTPSRFVKGAGYMLKVPSIDIAEVGSGGGSIARIDAGGLLVVGPESAGGDPGPACYGRGTREPTVTDANMVLGFLNPHALAGGSLTVDAALSQRAVDERVAQPLKLSAEDAAHGIRQVANVNMARAIRAVTVERGKDPRDLALMAFGGGGPLHAVDVARLLGITRVLISPVSGVFSAAGMLAAEAVHEFIRPLLAPLAEVKDTAVRQALDSMAADGRAALAVEGYGAGAVQLRYAADVRYLGQSSQLTVQMPAGPFDAAALHRAFERVYRETFGYVADGEPIELVNLRLSAIGTAATRLNFGGLSLDARALAGESGERLVSFERGKPRIKARLLPRAAVEHGPVAGPAIIESYDTTIVVPPGRTARAAGAGSIVIEMEEMPDAATAPGTSVGDPITFAVIKNAMDAIVDEVAYTVIRTARSEIVKDVMDYSAAICDAKGEMVAQAKTIAQHLGAIPEAMAAVQAKWGGKLSPGDAVIMNDPYSGGMHLPDIFMFFPIFDGAEVLAWSVVICHHTDVGGRVPGSNAADSTEIYQEGLRIPPLKLFRSGVMDETLEQLIGLNVRVPDRVIGDLRAQYAACQVGAREIARLVARHGAAGMRGYFAALLDYAERMARAEIATWPQGTYRFTDHIDSDGLSDDPVPLTVAVTVRGDGTLKVDWAGSSKQVRAAINSTLSFTKSNTFLSVRCALRGDIPNNAGVFRCIEVTAPEGSVLNPIAPAPVAARALTGYRVMDTMFGALAQIVPHVVPAAGEGGNTVVCLGGRHPDNKPFIIVDMISGCWGGRPDQDGIEAITNPSQNLSNTPVEVLERQHPVRIEDYALVEDSGGAGRFRGGMGLRRSYRVLADEAVMQLRADRLKFAPYGLDGGEPGGVAGNWLGEGNAKSAIPGKVTMTVLSGELLTHHQAGGGGHGDPFTREPEAVARDVWNGKVTVNAARARYGVEVDASGKVDAAETTRLRSRRKRG